MKLTAYILISAVFIALTACSTQEIKPETTAEPISSKTPPIKIQTPPASGQNPPMTLIKNDKSLSLVRVMDGGACKNELQGAKGVFLIYADAKDIERIKREKGPEIFSDFENKIQIFATKALQEAINTTNLNENPFALGADETQEQLTKQLVINFINSVAEPEKQFQSSTTLNVNVVPFKPSFMFYQHGCDAAHLEPEI